MFGIKTAKDIRIAQLESEVARLTEELNRKITPAKTSQMVEGKPEWKPPVTMMDWCRRMSTKSYQRALERKTKPLVAAAPLAEAPKP